MQMAGTWEGNSKCRHLQEDEQETSSKGETSPKVTWRLMNRRLGCKAEWRTSGANRWQQGEVRQGEELELHFNEHVANINMDPPMTVTTLNPIKKKRLAMCSCILVHIKHRYIKHQFAFHFEMYIKRLQFGWFLVTVYLVTLIW